MFDPPETLKTGGRLLWDLVTAAKVCNPGELVVLAEACRIKDRLDRMEALLTGDLEEWLRVRDFETERDSVIMIDGLVTEARLHAAELRQLVGKLGLPVAEPVAAEEVEEVDDPLAAARAARAERRAAAAGS